MSNPYEGSLLEDMENFLNDVSREQEDQSGVTVIRPNTTNLGSGDNNIEIFYQKLRDMGINMDELGNILDCQDNLLVLSGAGSGKTTALILKIIRDLISGDMMTVRTVNSVYGTTQVLVPAPTLVCTFLRTGAEELQAAFHEWCRRLNIVGLDSSNIKFRTIHAEVKDALTTMGVPVQVLEDTNKLVRSVMGKYNIRSVTATSRSATVDEVNDVASLLSFARNRLDNKRYEHPLLQDYRMDQILLDACLQDFKILRSQTGKMDFEDMQEMLLEACQINPNVAEFIAKRYDFVYVDEFQDTSQLQYELLKYYFKDSKRVIVIGDDDQTIYSWRGSDADIIAHKFEEDMNPTIHMLSTNYRCKSNILNFVKPSIEKNSNRHPKELKSYQEGGTVQIINGGDVNSLVTNMLNDMANGMKVGVLARVNQDLLIPAIILELNGQVEFSLSKSVSMNSRMARQVFGIMDLVLKRMTPEFEDYFKLFLPRYNWYEAEKLFNVLVANKSMNIYNIPFEDLRHSVPNLAPFLKGLRDAKELGNVEAYLYILTYMEKKVFVTDSLYSKKARDLVYFVKKIILEHEAVKDLTLEQIDDLFNNVLPERLNRRIKYSRDIFSKLTTVHEAKGKEWDSVYIWGNVQGSFPNIVGQRELSKEEYEEERRVHYIAVTRAKEKLTIYTESARMGDFLKECDMSFVTSVENSTPTTTVEKQKVFKSAQPERINHTDSILRTYVQRITEESSITDERYANMEIVMNQWSFEDLVGMLEKKYGIHLMYETEYEDILDDFFRTLADEIFNAGLV